VTGDVKVFTRQATGLTKEIGTVDTFVYNVNNQNIGIGVAFMLLFIPGFYAGADLFQSIVIAAVLALPMAFVYAFFSAAIPRSGGDYVYISRTLHPLLGFVASWNWVFWMTVYVGVPAAYFAQYGLSGLLRMLGVATSNSSLIDLGNNFVDPVWILAVGTLLIAFFAVIFALDSFAGGFVVQSLIAYWFYTRFGLGLDTLGWIFFGVQILSGLSLLLAARAAPRLGLVNTMVFSHLISNVLLIAVAVSPVAWLAIAFLLARHLLSQMDVPTRQSYTMAIVDPDERSAAAGITGIARSVGASLSPALSGTLMGNPALLGMPFFIAGGLKIVYDLLVYRGFKSHRPPEE